MPYQIPKPIPESYLTPFKDKGHSVQPRLELGEPKEVVVGWGIALNIGWWD
ncbi:MAG: hypothetical protein ACW990_07720 [Promethearchaeota archaeon]